MQCQEFLEYVSSFIDGELDKAVQAPFQQHLQACPRCRNEAELERITKNLIGHRLPRLYAPDALVNSIHRQIAPDDPAPSRLKRLFDDILQQLTWRTAIAIGSAAVIIFLLTFIPFRTHHSHAEPNDDSIIDQTYNNFDGVLDGKLAAEVSSDDPGAVRSFLASRVNFNLKVPRPKDCRLVSGAHSHYKCANLVHLTYQNDKGLIYLYEASTRAINDERVLGIPASVQSELQRTGWHVESHRPDCCLIMWVADSTVYCAVGDMDRDRLLASFKGCE